MKITCDVVVIWCIFLQINNHPLLDITHREVATLIATAKSDNIELLVHRASSADWLESSHDVYMAEQKGRGMVRKREPSWSDLEPWMEEEQVVASLPTIKEREPDTLIKEAAVVDNNLAKNGDDERPPEIPPELPPDDSLANIEEYPPPLPEEGPPSMMVEDEFQPLPQDDDDDGLPPPDDSNLSKSSKRTLDESTQSRGLHKEESFQGEPPLPPESEPPLLTFDDSSEELSWERDEQEQSTQLNTSGSLQSTPLHISGDSTPHHTLQTADEVIAESPPPKEAVDDTTVTNTSSTSGGSSEAELSGGGLQSGSGLTESGGGLPSPNGLTVNEDKQPSSEHDKRLSEAPSLELDTSFEQDNVFTITLKKGFRGLGFMLDKQRSLAEGM